MIRTLPILLIMFLLTQCVPPTEERLTEVRTDFEDPILQRIHDFQDRQLSDSLYVYLRHKDPSYRFASAMAFGSTKANEGIDSLLPLLSDEIEKVRVATAYALGQIGDAQAEEPLVQAFEQYDTAGTWARANAAILEAIGKCGSAEYLKYLSTISTYQYSDTLLLEGQAYGLYRFMRRGITSEEGTQQMLKFVTDAGYPNGTRFIAANYFERATDLPFAEYDQQLVEVLRREDDPRIRMSLVIGLGKAKTERARDGLLGLYALEQDYRVKCNILRALANFPYAEVESTIVGALDNPNYHIARTASEFLLNYGQPEAAKSYWQKAKDSLPSEVQLTLYAAANRHLPVFMSQTRDALNYELRMRYDQTEDLLERSMILLALGEFGWNYRYIKQKALSDENPMIRSTAVEAIGKAMQIPDFRTYYGNSYRRVRLEISQILQEAIASGDAGMTYHAARIFRTPGVSFRGTLDSLTLLEDALRSLELPREIEAYNELQQTIDFFEDRDNTRPRTPNFNHPIDWEQVTAVPNNASVVLKTNRGEIELELLPQYAPGSVINFVRLAKTDFYDGKTFHRVVPNHVIQGGCPRGDGFGGLDYSIRTEVPYLHYKKAGYVGMASAGLHTESTQFFITHAPRIHLDGNYTIFARVVSGLETVHAIQRGDQIIDVELTFQE
jgi:cyclophilin family peptidyl-prolyl cis-trans isomerase/HEAT repeat protein